MFTIMGEDVRRRFLRGSELKDTVDLCQESARSSQHEACSNLERHSMFYTANNNKSRGPIKECRASILYDHRYESIGR